MVMLETIGSVASILGLSSLLAKIWRRIMRRTVRIKTMVERGPISREFGITEPAVKITVVNETQHPVIVVDIRLMFCGDYGASIAPNAPTGRSHPTLPENLESGSSKEWYIPAEQLSCLMDSLHRPVSTTVQKSRKVRLRPRCISATGRVFKGSAFQYPVDPNCHGS